VNLLGLWLGACTSAPANEAKAPAHSIVAAAVPIVRKPVLPVVRIIVGGDVIPHRPQLIDPVSVGSALSPLAALFRTADAAVVNYETATGDISRIDESTLSLAAKPSWMRAIASAHVTALTLANNHACDLGRRGLAASIDAASSMSMTALGASRDDPWAAQTIAAKDGRRACAISWTTFVNDRRAGCMNAGHLAIAKPNREGRARVAKAIADATNAGCDAIVAIVHGGQEYAPQTEAMMTLARAAAEAGADAVVMHHPHVVSPLVAYETRDGRRVPIFSSLGNLVTNQGESWTPEFPAAQRDRHVVYMNGWTRLGMLADIELRLGGDKQRAVAWGDHLVWLESDHVLDKSNPHPRIAARTLDATGDAAIIAKLSRDAAGPRAIFDDACWTERRGADPASAPSCLP
jgi:poly-gamma-glutamate synthesis protein (capsule biosynthesis protein)